MSFNRLDKTQINNFSPPQSLAYKQRELPESLPWSQQLDASGGQRPYRLPLQSWNQSHGRSWTQCVVLRIPKPSPQLNMCDYALRMEVEKRMRAQEKCFQPAFRESRLAFLKRLRRTALRLLCSFINSSLKNIRIRCQRLAAAKGGHFR